jgi:hypothetical protein
VEELRVPHTDPLGLLVELWRRANGRIAALVVPITRGQGLEGKIGMPQRRAAGTAGGYYPTRDPHEKRFTPAFRAFVRASHYASPAGQIREALKTEEAPAPAPSEDSTKPLDCG